MKKFFSVNVWSLLLALAVSTMMFSCGNDEDSTPQPTAGFTFNPTSPKAGDAVTFMNSSENAETYTWDFGDGGTSTIESPSHTYEQAGTYTITLTAINGGKQDVTTQSISVAEATPAPVANFVFNPDPAVQGEEVTFENRSENAVSYQWDFNRDGVIDSEEENPTYVFEEAGAFRVKLIATGADGTTVEVEKPVRVEAKTVIAKILGIEVTAFDALGSDDFPVWNNPSVGLFDLPIDQVSSLGEALWVATFSDEGISADALPLFFGMDFPDQGFPAVEITDFSKPYYFFLGAPGAEENTVSIIMYSEVLLAEYAANQTSEFEVRDEDAGITYTVVIEWREE